MTDNLDHVTAVLHGALSLPDASLVLHRSGLLVELKTDLLEDKLSRYEEDGHVSWQIGGFTGHHCHVDLRLIERVVFDAEAVSCQGGKANFTIWFETSAPSGNPYRPLGYLSVTLNAPYDAEGRARAEILTAIHTLSETHHTRPIVEVTESFRLGLLGCGLTTEESKS
jgi:hypothetical protein